MAKTVARKTVGTKKPAKRAGVKKGAARPKPASAAAKPAAVRKASGARHHKPAGKRPKEPSLETMDALDFFVYTYSRI